MLLELDRIPAVWDAVWDYVGKDRYLQVAVCKSVAHFYSTRFAPSTAASLSKTAAEAGLVEFLIWTQEIGCVWDKSVFIAGARSGSVDVLAWLWANNCPIPKSGYEMCSTATALGHVEALRFLRDVCHCSWNMKSDQAAQNGHLEILKYASTILCPSWNKSSHFYSEMLHAAEYGQIHILEWALVTFPKESYKAFDELTCIHAARGARLEVLRWLRGLDCSWNEGTCWAAIYDGHLHVLKWAIAEGCPWTIKDRDPREGGTALHCVGNRRFDLNTGLHLIGKLYVDFMEYLISLGADVNARDNVGRGGRTPIYMAIHEAELEAVKLLVRAGAYLNVECGGGRSALGEAVACGHDDIAEYLRNPPVFEDRCSDSDLDLRFSLLDDLSAIDIDSDC